MGYKFTKQSALRNSQIKITARNCPTLPPSIYKIVLYIIKSYPLFKEQQNGHGKRFTFNDENNSKTESLAVHMANNNYRIEAIDKALSNIPLEYRQAVIDHVMYDKEYKYIDNMHHKTLYNYCKLFVFWTAKYLGEI